MDGAVLSAALELDLAAPDHGRGLVPLGLWVFPVGEQYAKRTGRLKRSG